MFGKKLNYIDILVKIEELKKLDSVLLKNEVAMLKKELFNARLKRGSGQVKDLSQARKLRADIARALTLLTQKNREQA